MAKPYSYDFRQKVVTAIEVDKRKKSEVSRLFKISRNTLDLWLERKEQTGDVLPEKTKPPGNNHKITNWRKFHEFVNQHGDKTQAQLAQLWSEDISSRTIARALKKMGYTRKKRLMATGSEMKLIVKYFWSN
jgi:transposase